MGRGIVSPRSTPASLPQALARRSRPSDETRIGILGGSFDPVHVGHLWLATLAADTLGLDRVLLMPAARPPHKRRRRLSNVADRIAMIRLAIAADPRLEVSLVETERPGPSYTVDSLAELRAHHGDASRLVLVMAADTFAQIDTWREPQRLLELAEWAVGPRPGSTLPERASLRSRFGAASARIHFIDGPSMAVSSSEVRRRVAAGRAIRYLVPAAVEAFIAERGLYRRPVGS